MLKKCLHILILSYMIIPVVTAQKLNAIIDSLYIELKNAKDDSARTLIIAELSYRSYLNPDSAYKLAHRGLALATNIGYDKGIVANQFAIGNYYGVVGDYLRAAEYIIKVIEWQKLYGDPNELARSYLILGFSSSEQLGYKRATFYFNKALESFERAKNKHDIVLVFNNLGVIYTMEKKYDSALYYLNKGLALAYKNNSAEFAAVIVGSIGEMYLEQKNFEKAEQFLRESLKLNEGYDMRIQSINYLKLAEIYRDTRQTKRMIESGLKSLEIAKQYNDLEQIEKASMLLHEVYLGMGDYVKAINYLKSASIANDSIYSIERNKELQKLTMHFEVKEKEAQIKILQQESSLQQISMQLQNASLKRQRFFLIGLVIVLILLFILLTWYRMINRIKRELEIERVRNNIAKDLHDDIGSTLSSIRIISKMGVQNRSTENSIRNFELIEGHSSKMLSTMADIVWSIDPGNDTMEKIVVYMKEFAAEILEPLNINYDFNISGHPEDLKVDLNVRKNLFLIFKESINNAAKYSNSTLVVVKITIDSGMLNLEIIDNGIGFDHSSIRCGNGLKNMKERAALMNGSVTITSKPGFGTRISFSTRIAKLKQLIR